MRCKEIQKQLSNYIDGGLGESERTAVEGHLATCEACAVEVKAIRRVLSEAVKLPKITAPENLWSAIESELDRKEVSWWERIQQTAEEWREALSDALGRSWKLAIVQIAGVAAILLMGILIGRYFWPNAEQPASEQMAIGSDANVRMAGRTNDYFEKSRVLFLGIVNADTSDLQNMDLSTERKVARNLLYEAAFLKDNLNPSRDAIVSRLVGELEMILITIANMEEQQDLENIELIKSGIDRQGVLLKINLLDFGQQKGVDRKQSL
jgi:hypothetical protein